MKPDAQFKEWWQEYLHKPPLDDDDVIPVLHALQARPSRKPQIMGQVHNKHACR